MKLVYWLSVAMIAYAYAGYPVILALVGWLRPRRVRRGSITPSVAFVITAHNEERRIAAKIENTLGQAYPRDAFEIIVASDGSTVGTDVIVRSFEAQGVRLVRTAERRGKEHAQRSAIGASRGEVLVFSDVGTTLAADGVATIVRNFADPTVGCVSSVDRVTDRDGRVSGEGIYVRYEMLLRRLETEAGGLVGLSGSFFAARRVVCDDWPIDRPSDFRTAFNAVRLGYRAIADPESVGYYQTLADESREFDRKVRTVLRGIGAVTKDGRMLDPLRHGMFAWQVWSHKLCRWMVPLFMLLALVSNAVLVGEPLYRALLVLQLGFYGTAAWGLARRGQGGRWVTRIPAFLVLANLSILSAWYRYMAGRRVVTWTPSER
ncbi:MAG: glycosyltransferase family 2 protein [Candidatus Rokuibacteriota bacterium]